MRKPLRAWSVVCGLLAAPALAQAQTPSSYPDRPIRLVVAFVAGGATDTLARQISNDLKEALGQPVVVENRPGANGYLAWNHVAGSEPDGYTLLLAENALGISQALHKKATSSFDPLTQYDAVAGDRDLALGAGRREQRAREYGSGAGRALAHGVAENELRLRRGRQRLASELRGVQGWRRDGSHSYSLQRRRPGDRRRDRGACPDGDGLGAGCQEPGGGPPGSRPSA